MIGSVIGFHEVNKADMCLQIVVLSLLMLSNIFISVNRPSAHSSFGITPNCHFDFVPCIASILPRTCYAHLHSKYGVAKFLFIFENEASPLDRWQDCSSLRGLVLENEEEFCNLVYWTQLGGSERGTRQYAGICKQN